ncbi:hypothetical protein BMS3Abin07_00590 [bacterium BMS3Abin07]|nr:hypothetical protein BMS3Abin07_00590 [bacterium BMS3Abin07]
MAGITKYLMVLSFFLFFFIYFLQIHVYNNDFWWHLASGKYIAEHHSLPQADPFSYTTHASPSNRKTIILKGYWLAQVIFYEVFSLWNLKGIIILRSLLMLLFLFVIFLNIRKQNVSHLTAIILIAGVFSVAITTGGVRPQLFTFLIFSIVFYLLEDFRMNRSKKVFLIPLLVMVLSNMHPGYIVCLLLISIYLSAQVILFFIKRDSGYATLRGLLAVWVLSILFSIFNPAGLDIFKEIFSIGHYTKGIVEFMPTFSLYAKKIIPVNYAYVIFLFFSLLSLRYFRKIGLVHILLLIVFSIMSFVSIRYVIFYMCIAAPIIARIIVILGEERIFNRLTGVLKKRETFLCLVSGVIGISLVFNAIPSFARYEFKEDESFAVPKAAADFLSKIKIRGNMFNEYGFGGYLIWRLYPDKKVFIDGRALELDALNEYNTFASVSAGQNRSWEDILKKYDISCIVMPPLLPYGKIYPIVEKLFEMDDWVLIYSDQLSLIFLRENSGNSSILEKFAENKEEGFNTIITQASARALRNKRNPYYLITLGKVFFKMGRIDDSEKAFLMASERAPDNAVVKEWLQKLRENKTERIKGR